MSIISHGGTLQQQIPPSVHHSRNSIHHSHTASAFSSPSKPGNPGSYRPHGASHLRNQSYFADGRRNSTISVGQEMREKRISFAANVHPDSHHSPRKPPQNLPNPRGNHYRDASITSELRKELNSSPALDVITGRKSIPSIHENHPSLPSNHLVVPPLPSPTTPSTSITSDDPLLPPQPAHMFEGGGHMPRMERNSKLGPDDMLKAYASNNTTPQSSIKEKKKKSKLNFLSMLSDGSKEDEQHEANTGGEGYINFRQGGGGGR